MFLNCLQSCFHIVASLGNTYFEIKLLILTMSHVLFILALIILHFGDMG